MTTSNRWVFPSTHYEVKAFGIICEKTTTSCITHSESDSSHPHAKALTSHRNQPLKKQLQHFGQQLMIQINEQIQQLFSRKILSNTNSYASDAHSYLFHARACVSHEVLMLLQEKPLPLKYLLRITRSPHSAFTFSFLFYLHMKSHYFCEIYQVNWHTIETSQNHETWRGWLQGIKKLRPEANRKWLLKEVHRPPSADYSSENFKPGQFSEAVDLCSIVAVRTQCNGGLQKH